MFLQLLQFHDIGLLALRLVLGIIFLVHGFPKFKNAGGMAQGFGIPTMSFLFTFLAFVEVVAGALAIVGLYVQFAAFVFLIIMIGAMWFKLTKWHVPFIATNNTGWEFDLLIFASSLVLLLSGGGSIGL